VASSKLCSCLVQCAMQSMASIVDSTTEGNISLVVQCPVHQQTEGNLDLFHKERAMARALLGL
jgi:hypothetical protein